MNNRPILVTSALPYANGPIHFGHIAGAYLPADAFTRFHRLKKTDIKYICGTDEYGVAVTISADKEGRTPKEQVDHYHSVIKDIFNKFNISFDHFSRTTTETHSELSQKFFRELHNNGHIEKKEIEQLYCEKCSLYLADRFVEGTCYLCGFEHARGDECPGCGAWLEPLKLKAPRCKICSAEPEVKKTTHWFLKLGNFKEKLHTWLDQHQDWKPNVINVVRKQIDELESRAITRDLKWGVPVPLEEAGNKVLYVWFDAPIGYIDATMEWARQTGDDEKWKYYWQNPDCRIINFIGKDNIPFHLMVWPAMMMGQTTTYTLAENVPANEFLNLQGRQFSKSEGWYVDLDSFFKKYSADQIRYCLAASAPETKDSDFSWKDFQKYNNSDLAGVLGNLLNRMLMFTKKNYNSQIPAAENSRELFSTFFNEISERKQEIAALYDSFKLKKASFAVIDLARMGNRFFDELAPWKLIKEDKDLCGKVLYSVFFLLETLATVAWPIIPQSAENILKQLGLNWDLQAKGWDSESLIPDDGSLKLGEPEILFSKIEDSVIEEEISKLEKNKPLEIVAEKNYTPLSQEITFDDFLKPDLRVGKIISAEKLKKSKKLLKLKVDLGFEQRQIIAGIALKYKPQDLLNKKVVVVANLAPRKLMGELSEGMILAASLEDELNLISADESEAGAKIS